jgi:membrane-associated phospholipid phosphatase
MIKTATPLPAEPLTTAADRLDARPSAELVPPSGTLDPGTAIVRGRRASWVAMLGVSGFAAIFGLVRARRSEALDIELMAAVQRLRHPVAETAMRAASWPGFPPQSRLITPAVLAGLLAARLRTEALGLVVAWGTALVSMATKAVMRRPRPVANERLRVVAARLGGSSFPSGHVITYVGVYGFLAYLANTLVRPVAIRRALTAALLGLVALVGPSRVHQGHHWPTDVTASYLLGTAYLIATTSVYRRLKTARARRVGRHVPDRA